MMVKTLRIDLNCDMGESFGRWPLGEDEAVMQWITSASIACGLHAGDPMVMERTVALAKARGVAVGAHPGYPDLQGFGRRVMDLTPDETEAFTLYQIGALAGFARSQGVELVHVKPHGALYNQAAKDAKLAAAIASAARRFSRNLILVGLPGSALIAEGEAAGLQTASEGFPDRAYEPDGSLRSRRLPGAVLESIEEIRAQAVRLATEGIGGSAVQTICIHGDHAGAADHAKAVRDALEEAGVIVTSLKI